MVTITILVRNSSIVCQSNFNAERASQQKLKTFFTWVVSSLRILGIFYILPYFKLTAKMFDFCGNSNNLLGFGNWVYKSIRAKQNRFTYTTLKLRYQLCYSKGVNSEKRGAPRSTKTAISGEWACSQFDKRNAPVRCSGDRHPWCRILIPARVSILITLTKMQGRVDLLRLFFLVIKNVCPHFLQW